MGAGGGGGGARSVAGPDTSRNFKVGLGNVAFAQEE